ncbi:MAG: HAD-IIB family hydrolase [Planctomycetes bacterium]|nr:HAD-IIB family hydrolase [Planctomycetota bacterium]
MSAAWIVFSDLDETLLDRRTYSFEAARPALEELRRRGIPLILCTSKTAGETLHFQKRLGITDPFIVEGGGGVYVPRAAFGALPVAFVERGAYHLLPLSAGTERVLEGYRRLKQFTERSILGFSEQSAEEVGRDTGLPLELARLAKEREFDEPFRFLRREAEFAPRLPGEAARQGLRVSRGGRYWHVHGDTDKGRAVRLVADLYRRFGREVRTVGLGDSAMDRPMLEAVDVPFAVARRDGTHDPALVDGLAGVRRVPAAGPEGWRLAAADIFNLSGTP